MAQKAKWYPNQLVHVEHPAEMLRYHHFGEVMSFETPDNTVMVRRVPGVAATLSEVPVSILRAEESRKRIWWVHYAKVRTNTPGRARFASMFPTDMLRYDNAAPANFTLSIEGEKGWEQAVIKMDEGFKEEDGLIVARLMGTKTGNAFYRERWRSFGWSVEPMHVDKFERGDL